MAKSTRSRSWLRWLGPAALALLSLCTGCTQYNLSGPTIREQAAQFGENARPKEKPASRWGYSERAQQIEHSVGL